MTDDQRFRAPRVHGYSQRQSQAGTARVRRTEDPLAELARLIGQEDPFADFVAHRPADNRAAGASANVAPRRARPQDARGFDTRPAERRRPAAPDSFDDQADRGAIEAPRGNGRTAYAYGRNRSAPAPFRGLGDDRAEHAHRETVRRAPLPDGLDTDAGDDFERPAADARSARRAPAPSRHDDSYDYAGSEYDPDYADDAYLPAHGDEFYEEAPRRRLKGWLLAGVAAAAMVVVGVSGLFAYRAIFNVDNSGKPPVTIRPEAGPTKVAPGSETKAADGGNKQSYDRVGGEPAPSGERIVSRQESPVTPDRIPQGSPAPSPAGVVTAAPQFTAAPTQAAPMSPPPPISTEPRRVRTVTVRSDGTVVSDPARASAPANTARTGPAPASNAPMALQGGSQPAGGQPPALPPARPGTSSAAPSTDNPWANLSSQGQYATPGTPAPTQQAALPPQQPAPAPAIAVSTPPPAGSYVVQVAAQKTEADAQSTWQSLQQRYPAILQGQQAQIRRVDLGERGVFYRAQVGPFSSRSQASEVCQSLKAAGGECVIQRN